MLCSARQSKCIMRSKMSLQNCTHSLSLKRESPSLSTSPDAPCQLRHRRLNPAKRLLIIHNFKRTFACDHKGRPVPRIPRTSSPDLSISPVRIGSRRPRDTSDTTPSPGSSAAEGHGARRRAPRSHESRDYSIPSTFSQRRFESNPRPLRVLAFASRM